MGLAIKIPARVCPECGETFTPSDPRRLFCTPAHARAWNNLQISRGASLVPLLQAWRQGRHVKGGDEAAKMAFAEAVRLLDSYTAADREAGRQPALKVVRSRYRRAGAL